MDSGLQHQEATSIALAATRSHLSCSVSMKRWTDRRRGRGKWISMKTNATTTTTTTPSTYNTTQRAYKMRAKKTRRNPLEITMSRVAARYCIVWLISMLWLSATLAGIHCQASHEVQTGLAPSISSLAQHLDSAGEPLAKVSSVATATAAAVAAANPKAQIHKRTALGLLMPINELRVSGSKNEPPSRPTVDWSKQRPYFGPDIARNVSVELGKTAYLSCKVFELGDKTVSWLRPRENEILTAGRFTYIGDPRFASINDNGSHDWILEIKDVGLNDSTSYECQVSTDPKMSTIINLHVKAAKARIKQGEQFYAPLGSNIEFTCEVGQKHHTTSSSNSLSAPPTSPSSSSSPSPSAATLQQTYWYFNGNLLNYARTFALDKNFSIDWDPMTQTSRFKLFNVQLSDAGNYTCKPTSSEPTNIRLHVKRYNKNASRDRVQHNVVTKEAQRNRQQYGLELTDSSASVMAKNHWFNLLWPLLTLLLILQHH